LQGEPLSISGFVENIFCLWNGLHDDFLLLTASEFLSIGNQGG
jgi:hypothetical protein